MTKIKLSGYLIIILLLACTNNALGQFTLSGEFRPRAEYRHGYKTLAEEDQRTAFFIEQRSRINLDYKHEKYKLKLVLQDVRTWGSQSQLVNNGGSLTSIHEAWADVAISEKLRAKIGRQEIVHDESRIFGNVGWLQQARSHDAVIVKYAFSQATLDLGLAFNQNGPQNNTGFYSIPNSYKTFQFLRYVNKFGALDASLLFLNNGKQGGDPTDYKTYFSQTIGTHLNYNAGKFKPTFSFYYQGGKEPDGNTSIDALQYMLNLSYQLTDKTSITAGTEYLSGNDQVDPSATNKAFNPFYGTNHKFNGLMDYFYVGNHIGSVGLQDIYFLFHTKFNKVNTQVQIHYFTSDGDVLGPENGQAMSKGLGTEIDLVFSYKPSDVVTLTGGYSQMFGTNTMVTLKGATNNDAFSNWGWLMLTLKPTFFTTKKN